jgi:DNA-binding beta-propeller fold protein YncE
LSGAIYPSFMTSVCAGVLCLVLTAYDSLPPRSPTGAVRHYEYVFPDQGIYVYDEDREFALVKTISLPEVRTTRGVAVSLPDAMLYISYGGHGGHSGNGSLLKYDLMRDVVVWTRQYGTGIDSMAISPDGKRIYMPTGSLTRSGLWLVIDAGTGEATGRIDGGSGPHNTVVSLDGARVYLGGRRHNYLEVADTATNQVIGKIGPLVNTVRPFTINGKETLSYTTATRFLGFQVSDVVTGKVLYTVNGFGSQFAYDPNSFPVDGPCHGISLSPDEREIYVLDAPNSHVHVFDVSGVPSQPPRQVADIKVQLVAADQRDGWVQHSRDGRFVFIGDSGEVIDTATRAIVASLPALRDTRKHLDVIWQDGVPVATSTRTGVGYVRP